MELLLVDDEVVVEQSLGRFLRDLGYGVTFVNSAAAALAALRRRQFDLVLTDIRMPGKDGIALTRELGELSPDIGVIVMTGHGDMETAIGAMRAGAFDYLLKPIDLNQLQLALARALRCLGAERRSAGLAAELRRERSLAGAGADEPRLLGNSRALGDVRRLLERAAAGTATVLLTGESGTGKELAARLLHRQGPLPQGPFIAVNCTTFTPALIESELFGHEKGAFTGADRARKGVIELAADGTLFLDEIGDMPLPLQGHLLRVLEERCVRRIGGERDIPVRIRLVSSTNRDLPALVAAGRFRQDLYFRLRVMSVEMPPLRVRREDIPLLAEHFAALLARSAGRAAVTVAPAAMAALVAYDFPGNVRELRNLIEQAFILADGDVLELAHFPVLREVAKAPGASLAGDIDASEKTRIEAALLQTRGSIRDAAALLRVGYGSLRYRITKLGIKPNSFRP